MTTVHVHVGVGGKQFVLHQSALCDVSPFFKKTFLGPFKEGQEKKLDLPVTDLSTFELFVEWLYSRRVIINLPDHKDSDNDVAAAPAVPVAIDLVNTSKLSRLASLYVFADNYDVPQLRNDTMDTMIFYLRKRYPLPGPTMITYIYDHVPEDSSLCKLLTNEYARSHPVLPGVANDWPPRFVFETFNAGSRAVAAVFTESLPEPELDCRAYHHHATDAEREDCLSI